MANECMFCGERHGETNAIILNGGAFWVEFCAHCGENHVLHNEQGEAWLVRDLFMSGQPGYVRKAEDIEKALKLSADELDRQKNEYSSDPYFDAEWDEAAYREMMDNRDTERRQLLADGADILIDRQLHSRRFKPHADALRLLVA